MVAEHGWKLLPQYRFEPTTGLWKHRGGPVEPPLRLAQLRYDEDGILRFPPTDDLAPDTARADALAAAAETVRERVRMSIRAPAAWSTELGADFEHLRWFELPAECLTPA